MIETGLALIGDIGGTNARFALVRSGERTPEAIEVLACSDYDNLAPAIVAYLHRVGVQSVRSVCLAVASPVHGTQVRMTNNHWHFDSEELRRRFGWHSVRVVNDFTAMASGIPRVAADKLIHICGGPGDIRRPRLVIGPGTGLGVSALVPSEQGWIPLVTEGGHVDFAPATDDEMAILRTLRARFGRVSVERILSGQGLLNLYQAYGDTQGVAAPLDSPEQITAAALDSSDPLATGALAHFCGILGRVAGNAVLTLGATGGVYLCGGMLPRFVDFLQTSPFQQGFEDKGRMRPLLESTPVYLVTDGNTGLLGAAETLTSIRPPQQ